MSFYQIQLVKKSHNSTPLFDSSIRVDSAIQSIATSVGLSNSNPSSNKTQMISLHFDSFTAAK